MIQCNLALQKLIADELCGEICCCVDCDKVEICNERCTYIDEAETCDEAIREDGCRTYYLVETNIYNDGSVRNELSEVEANKKPLNGEGSFLDCNVEYRYFDTEREARAYLGR
ncbi:MAG: hypothetical protein HFE90_06930 [Firmicutes bacterium]|nr:hypothetical protein [Bacillota bacterium]